MVENLEPNRGYLELRVKDAFKEDAGKGIVRVDPIVMNEMNLKTGDVIEIIHPPINQRTVALVNPGKEDDKNKNIIRIDPSIRRNINSSIDDIIKIRKIEANKAENIIFICIDDSLVFRNTQQLSRRLENRVITKGDVLSFYTYGKRVDLVVVDFTPKSAAVRIDLDTKFELTDKIQKDFKKIETDRITYEDIGGLDGTIQKIREMIELPFRHPEIFKRIGVSAPKGVLLYGPPGTGKTLLARAVAYETDAHFLKISGPEIMSKYYGQSEENLRKIFDEAKARAPAIIFLDEMDSIAPKRGDTGEVERRVVAQLLALMDGLETRGEIIIMGATNRINDIDEALRRPGRFDREIEIEVPDIKGRYEVLLIHTRGMPLDSDVDLRIIAKKTHGFVGADLELLTKEAAILAIRDFLPIIDLEKEIPPKVLLGINIKMKHLMYALRSIQPSALREVSISTPTETWEEIGGLDEVKQQLKEVVEWPFKYPKLYKHLDSEPPNGILLYGPPGTGKTLIAKALANESDVNFISIKGPELLSKWVGESERAIRETFRKARSAAPCVIFFDEIDAIAGMREQNSQDQTNVISQLLTEMDGLEDLRSVIILAATNRPNLLDTALLRSGRFGRHIEIPLPDLAARRTILNIHLRNKPLANDINLKKFAEKLNGFSGSDIKAICEEAVLLTIRKAIKNRIEFDNDEAVNKVTINYNEIYEAFEIVNKSIQRAKKTYENELNSERIYL
ncbi:MAG: CDC48 family AAA ATPase [Candidatus Lokiarchaeota archaeon]|nr:CDC48 family AAA ATPase [Candidatus Lokiarchaeota archaeon]